MTDSILNSTKKVLGIMPDYTEFDIDILMHINTVLSTLNQLGVGPEAGFFVEDDQAVWADFLGGDLQLNPVKTYVYLRVRMLFDPPTTSFAIGAMEKQIQEMEWRLNVAADTATPTTTTDDGTEVWLLSQTDPLPADVQSGDVAYDPNTGDLWRIV